MRLFKWYNKWLLKRKITVMQKKKYKLTEQLYNCHKNKDTVVIDIVRADIAIWEHKWREFTSRLSEKEKILVKLDRY